MKQFELINDDKKVIFNFPTSAAEITEDYLKAVTDEIKVADHYVLLGLLYRETIGRLVIARRQSKKSITSGVTPIFIKSGNVCTEFVKGMNVKDRVIVATSQLSLAHHVIVPGNTLSLDHFINRLDRDTTVTSRYSNNFGNEEVYLIEFKLIPSSDIVGFYSSNKITFNNPYFAVTNIEE